MLETLQTFFQNPIFSLVWTQSLDLAYWLAQEAICFFLLVEILKRQPFKTKHNFKLAHTERPFFTEQFGSELLWPMVTWIILIPAFFLFDAISLWQYLSTLVPKHSLHFLIIDLPFWLQVVIGTVVIDFTLYIRHRFVHHFAWSYHSIHHAAKEITWITWLRLHPGDAFIMGFIATAVLWALGFDAPSMFFAHIVVKVANRINHSNIQLDFGFPLRYVFVSPNMHRWHHGTTEEAKNVNFCILWAWIDVLFRTFYVPAYQLPEKYGAFDEYGNDLMGPSWMDQFLYPFTQHWKSIRVLGTSISTLFYPTKKS